MNKPLISIITINYNNLEGLKKTMSRVFEQTWQEFEYIIIDGGSTDGSKEYISSQASSIDYWISEPDSGIYNAMNKGIKVATGEYLLFLNSGDWLYENSVLEEVYSKFTEKFSIYYGNVERIYEGNIKKVKNYPTQLSFSFFRDSALGHQAVFIKRSLFFELFFYNEDYRILADWEFLCVAICKYNVKSFYLNMIVASYPMDGISSSREGLKVMVKEREKCYKQHFTLFIEDYKLLESLKSFYNNPRVRLFSKLDGNPKARRIIYSFMKVLNKFI